MNFREINSNHWLCHSILIIFFSFMGVFNQISALVDFCGEPVLQLGWFNATQGKQQHIDIQGLIGDDFSVSNSSDQNFLIGLGYYFDWLNTSKVNLSLGFNAFYLSPTKVKGNVTQENLFTNLSYHYSITNYPIYFATRALINCTEKWGIVIDLGIGPNIICTEGFKEKSLDRGITIPDEIFSGKNVTALSATTGLGWRINNIWGCFSFEIDYRFFYLGQGRLKKINNQVKHSLQTGNSYANSLIFTISI